MNDKGASTPGEKYLLNMKTLVDRIRSVKVMERCRPECQSARMGSLRRARVRGVFDREE
jgi:hypothetical protein